MARGQGKESVPFWLRQRERGHLRVTTTEVRLGKVSWTILDVLAGLEIKFKRPPLVFDQQEELL